MRVGFIGLGSQGGPMARRIVEGGYERRCGPAGTPASNRMPTRRPRPPVRLPSWRPPVIWSACASSATTTSERCSTATSGVLAGLASGGIVAIHSTVHPDTCKEIAESAAAQGVSVIDAPVSGGGPAVEEGKLLVMAGGDEDVVDRCRPVFATYADPIVHLGPLGSGQVTKILNNLLFTANLGSALSTLDLGESLGIARSAPGRGAHQRIRHQQGARQHRRVRWHRRGPRVDRRRAAAEGRPARGEHRRRRVGAGRIWCSTAADAALRVDGPSAMTRVGFVGAGRMGGPMVLPSRRRRPRRPRPRSDRREV